jgi:hypothetical protein
VDQPQDPLTNLARQVAEAGGPATPVEVPDEPNPAVGFLGLLLAPLLRRRGRRAG